MDLHRHKAMTTIVDYFFKHKAPEMGDPIIGLVGDRLMDGFEITNCPLRKQIALFTAEELQLAGEAFQGMFRTMKCQEVPYPTKDNPTWAFSHQENIYWRKEFQLPKKVFDKTTQPREELQGESHWRYHEHPASLYAHAAMAYVEVRKEEMAEKP